MSRKNASSFELRKNIFVHILCGMLLSRHYVIPKGTEVSPNLQHRRDIIYLMKSHKKSQVKKKLLMCLTLEFV